METIVGADESTDRVTVNNDIWSNAVSVQALETALDAADMLGVPISRAQRTGWRHGADKLKLAYFGDDGVGPHRLLHREYDEYFWDNGSKWLHTSIGQTDTVLLGFPLQFNASHRVWRGHKDQVRLNDIKYYGAHISPTGSYMTAGHCEKIGLLCCVRSLADSNRRQTSSRGSSARTATSPTRRNGSRKVGRRTSKIVMLSRFCCAVCLVTLKSINCSAPWRLWSEHDCSDGGSVNFITAGGMFLQSLVMGYGGLRFNDGGVSMDPLLPPNVTAMKLRGLNYADAEFDVAVGAGGANFSRRAGRGDGGGVAVRRAPDGVHWLTRRPW